MINLNTFSLSLSPVYLFSDSAGSVDQFTMPLFRFSHGGFPHRCFYILSPVKFSLKHFPFYSFLFPYFLLLSLCFSLSLSFFSLFLPLSFSLISYSESSFVVKNDDLSKGSEKNNFPTGDLIVVRKGVKITLLLLLLFRRQQFPESFDAFIIKFSRFHKHHGLRKRG